jgi:hypothetical protein
MEWNKKVLEKIDRDTLVEQFDNDRAEGSMIPVPKMTQNCMEIPLRCDSVQGSLRTTFQVAVEIPSFVTLNHSSSLSIYHSK